MTKLSFRVSDEPSGCAMSSAAATSQTPVRPDEGLAPGLMAVRIELLVTLVESRDVVCDDLDGLRVVRS
jgi:hypothetical protein